MPSSKRLMELCHTLATMLDAGVHMERALDVASRQSRSARLRRALSDSRRRIVEGSTLTDAMTAQGCFPPLFLHLVEAGENSGALDHVLARLSRFYEHRNRLWRRFLAGITMPVIQYIVAVAIIALVNHIISGIDNVPSKAVTILVLGYGVPPVLVALYMLAARTLGGARICHEIILHIPVLGGTMRSMALSRFSLVLLLMMEAGFPVTGCLARAFAATGNGAFAARSSAAIGAIRQGGSMTDALTVTGLFKPDYLAVISVAEESGKLTQRLEWLTDEYTDRAERAIAVLARIAAVLIWIMVASFIMYFIITLSMGHISQIRDLTG